MDTYTNYPEALEEAERLTKMIGRNVIPQRIDCDCEFWAGCEKCEGKGIYLIHVYELCNHPLADDDANEECREFGCAEREERRKEAA